MLSSTIPVSLIIDDGAPVNPLYFHQPFDKHTFIIPNTFTRKFAKICHKQGIKGKFSVIPMPSELGRIDEKLNYVSKAHLDGFINITKKEIMPLFDISPEIITHQSAYDIKHKSMLHMLEDEYIARLDADKITEYISFALEILKNAGLHPTGVTSPWFTGIKNEKEYVEGISRAFYQVYSQKFAWYFLHCDENGSGRAPWLAYKDDKSGRHVMSIAANTADPFWCSQFPYSLSQARSSLKQKLNELLTENGKSGRLRELFNAGIPLTILTHWQSLFSDGRELGLQALDELASRINKNFGKDIEWMKCSTLAKLFYK